MSLTTDQAAELLGISPAGVRQLVRRGHLAPLAAGTRPLLFDEQAVADTQHARRAATWKAAARHAARQWDAACADADDVSR